MVMVSDMEVTGSRGRISVWRIWSRSGIWRLRICPWIRTRWILWRIRIWSWSRIWRLRLCSPLWQEVPEAEPEADAGYLYGGYGGYGGYGYGRGYGYGLGHYGGYGYGRGLYGYGWGR